MLTFLNTWVQIIFPAKIKMFNSMNMPKKILCRIRNMPAIKKHIWQQFCCAKEHSWRHQVIHTHTKHNDLSPFLVIYKCFIPGSWLDWLPTNKYTRQHTSKIYTQTMELGLSPKFDWQLSLTHRPDNRLCMWSIDQEMYLAPTVQSCHWTSCSKPDKAKQNHLDMINPRLPGVTLIIICDIV